MHVLKLELTTKFSHVHYVSCVIWKGNSNFSQETPPKQFHGFGRETSLTFTCSFYKNKMLNLPSSHPIILESSLCLYSLKVELVLESFPKPE